MLLTRALSNPQKCKLLDRLVNDSKMNRREAVECAFMLGACDALGGMIDGNIFVKKTSNNS